MEDVSINLKPECEGVYCAIPINLCNGESDKKKNKSADKFSLIDEIFLLINFDRCKITYRQLCRRPSK